MSEVDLSDIPEEERDRLVSGIFREIGESLDHVERVLLVVDTNMTMLEEQSKYLKMLLSQGRRLIDTVMETREESQRLETSVDRWQVAVKDALGR